MSKSLMKEITLLEKLKRQVSDPGFQSDYHKAKKLNVKAAAKRVRKASMEMRKTIHELRKEMAEIATRTNPEEDRRRTRKALEQQLEIIKQRLVDLDAE